MTALCETKACGSMLLMMRKMMVLSFFFARMQSTLRSWPVYQPWPSRMVTPWSSFVPMALAISYHFFEKIMNCTDCR